MKSLTNCVEVNIPDPNLEAVIRDKINKPEEPITKSDLEGITFLEAPDNNIRDITGIEGCVNLERLFLGGTEETGWRSSNEIEDISPIVGLTKLTELWLGANKIRDITPLSNLTNLAILVLQGNQITDITPLTNLTNLTILVLAENEISDIIPLSNLTKLTELYLSDNQIEDIQPLVENKGLAEGDRVDLQGNPLNETSINTYIPRLKERGVEIKGIYYPYPKPDELKKLTFSEDWLQVQPLLDEDINSTFSNIDDLEWLKPIAQENRVILLGESPHYGQIIHHLVNRIFFALNTFDWYPLLIVETAYSFGVFWDYYVGLKNDKEARDFYQGVMYDMVDEEEGYKRLEHLRRWIKIHPDKRIHVGGHDMEFDYRTTLRRIIISYFQLLDPSFNIDLEKITHPPSKRDWNLLGDLEARLKEAKEKNLIGPYPFLTPEYIECVLENLKSRFFDNRSHALVRNLTDPRFLGKYLREGKAVIHVGGDHVTRRDREGPYLSSEFEPTKGKTASIFFRFFAFSLGSMKDVNLDSCLFHGRGYHRMVEQLQWAYQQGLIEPEEYYLPHRINEFEKLIFKKAYAYNCKPLLVKNIEWEQLIETANKVSPELYKLVRYWEDKASGGPKHYDTLIFVPRTRITRLKERKEN